jgi:hypothetical protein
MRQPRYPESWLRIMKLVVIWWQLPDNLADAFVEALSKPDQVKFDAFISSREPKKFLKDLERNAKKHDVNTFHNLISSLPPDELRRILRYVLSDKRLSDNLSVMKLEDLRWLLILSALPKELLVSIVFSDTINDKMRSRIFGKTTKGADTR